MTWGVVVRKCKGHGHHWLPRSCAPAWITSFSEAAYANGPIPPLIDPRGFSIQHQGQISWSHDADIVHYQKNMKPASIFAPRRGPFYYSCEGNKLNASSRGIWKLRGVKVSLLSRLYSGLAEQRDRALGLAYYCSAPAQWICHTAIGTHSTKRPRTVGWGIQFRGSKMQP